MHSTAAVLEFVDMHRSQSIQRAQSESATNAAESAMNVGGEMMLNGKSALLVRYEGVLW